MGRYQRYLGLFLLTGLLLIAAPAEADDGVGAGTGDGSFDFDASQSTPSTGAAAPQPNVEQAVTGRQPVYQWVTACGGNSPDTDSGASCTLATLCPSPQQVRMWLFIRRPVGTTGWSDWEQQPGSTCREVGDPVMGTLGGGEVTPADVLTAFRRLPLPAGTLQVQPNGRTLVNLDTIFSAQSTLPAAPYALTLLGHDVRVRAHEQTWTFDFGDGTALDSDTPGAPYPRRDITHDYTRKGSYQVSVQVTYTGQYSVDGGGWQDVPGTATVPGAPVPLQVLEARTQLVADPA